VVRVKVLDMKNMLISLLAAGGLMLASIGAHAGAGELRTRYNELREPLRTNAFGRALHIDSTETPDTLKGDVYAVLDHSFATVSSSLKAPGAWCDVLILPFNTKYCHAVDGASAPVLMVRIGRKYNQHVDNAHRLEFAYQHVAAGRDFFETRLDAKTGPVGTRDYRITVSAIPLDNGRTFMHLSYSYGYGMAGRMAMQAYLSTAGASKVGFSVSGQDGEGKPVYIGGVRGAVERNAMRYYLAIDAYLDSLAVPVAQRAEKRIQSWFSASEQYPRQLREMDRPTYVTMKRQEVERQQTLLQ
jgi:hypothetical protein